MYQQLTNSQNKTDAMNGTNTIPLVDDRMAVLTETDAVIVDTADPYNPSIEARLDRDEFEEKLQLLSEIQTGDETLRIGDLPELKSEESIGMQLYCPYCGEETEHRVLALDKPRGPLYLCIACGKRETDGENDGRGNR